jgi:FkbM family methyltransferase
MVQININGPFGKMAKRDIYLDMHRLLGLLKINYPVIVDGGACVGTTLKKILRRRPGARVHAFEARPDLARKLADRYKQRKHVTVYNQALANKQGNIKFNITKYIGTGSTLVPSQQSKRFNKQKVSIVKNVKVQSVRLDKSLKHVDVLKLDVQGSELSALEGSKKLFDQMKLIIIEVMFYQAYNNQPLFSDLDLFLRKNRFQLFNFYELSTNKSGKLTAGDALYINTRFYNKF